MSSTVTSDPQVMHGTPCFGGTRVPVRFLFEYLASGYNVEYFLMQFPTVEREQALAALAQASERAEREATRISDEALAR